ncbi:MAG: hypothetical protein ACRDY7_16900 [Acidimicrobiia bacterium]
MKTLVRTELLKLRTTRTVYGLLAATLGLTTLGVVVAMLTAGEVEGSFGLETAEGLRNLIASGWPGAIFVLVLGILAVTGEFRHNTLTPTFLAAPRRGEVVAAKLAAFGLVGLAFSVLASIITLAISLPWLAARGVEVSFFSAEVGLVLLGQILATALYGVLGVGVGALIRSQAIAMTAALVWMMMVEGILAAVWQDGARWLPGGAAQALSRSASQFGELLPMWAGGLLLAAYGVAFATSGARFVLRRDVT